MRVIWLIFRICTFVAHILFYKNVNFLLENCNFFFTHCRLLTVLLGLHEKFHENDRKTDHNLGTSLAPSLHPCSLSLWICDCWGAQEWGLFASTKDRLYSYQEEIIAGWQATAVISDTVYLTSGDWGTVKIKTCHRIYHCLSGISNTTVLEIP